MTIFSGSVLVGGLVHLEKRKQKGKKKKGKGWETTNTKGTLRKKGKNKEKEPRKGKGEEKKPGKSSVAVWLKALECTVINDSLDRIHGYPWVNFPPLGAKSSCWMLENLNLPGHSGCSGRLPPQSDRVIGVRSLVKMGHPTVSLHIGACPHEKEDISWKKNLQWSGRESVDIQDMSCQQVLRLELVLLRAVWFHGPTRH